MTFSPKPRSKITTYITFSAKMKLGYVRTLINIEIIIIVLVFVPFLEFSMSLRSKQGRTQVDYDLTPIYIFLPQG